MLFTNISINGLNPSPNSATASAVHVVITDASNTVVFDDTGSVGTGATNGYVLARLDNGVYTITAQAQTSTGTACGPILTLSGVIVTDTPTTLPSFSPTGIQVSW